MKRIFTIQLVLWMVWSTSVVSAQSILLKGRVVSELSSTPLVGATILVKNTTKGTVTDLNGAFELQLAQGKYTLTVSYIGFESKEILLESLEESFLEVTLKSMQFDLREFEIVSTGYQQLPRERATGSFVQIDEQLVNRRISTNIIDRLEDVTPGLIMNRTNVSRDMDIDIRGRSTIFGNSRPLIIIDNFPYDGDLSALNPNDVASITVLKDAAASSIWGVRAANGVIVINTKQGKFDKPTQITLNSNFTSVESNDMFYLPVMGSSDVLEVERLLFDRGYWDTQSNNITRPPIPMGAETLMAQRDGLIGEAEAQEVLSRLANQDLRNDYQNELYRKAFKQQYSLQAQGGTKSHRFFYGLGLDSNQESLKHNSNQRITLNTRQLFNIGTKWEVDAGVYFVHASNVNPNPGPGALGMTATRQLPIYYNLRDANGLPAVTPREYRQDFTSSAVGLGLLDWEFRPLDELSINTVQSKTTDIRINTGLKYNIQKGFDIGVSYQYWNANTEGLNYRPLESFFSRNLINQYTQVLDNGQLQQGIPAGGIGDMSNNSSFSHSLRFQTNYSKKWGVHEVNALGGFEFKSLDSNTASNRLYGYSMENTITLPVDYVSFFRNFAVPAQQLRIPFNTGINGFYDRFASFFANASYTWKEKLTFSASGRKDMSNIFGVDSNLKGVPLYSFGTAWLLSNEEFYGSSWLPYSRFRLTYGYNGNVDNSLSSLAVAGFSGSNIIGLPSGLIISNPNPELRWERMAMLNFGYDFSSKNDVVSGTFEAYLKRSTDLIGTTGFPPSSGITQFRGNFAETEGWGIDFNFTTLNIRGPFQWKTNFFFSTVREKVTLYDRKESALAYVRQGAGMGALSPVPFEGRPLFSVYSFPSAGLDPDTGDPRGFLDGEPSPNVATVIANTVPEDLVFHGSARPTSFGAIMNTFSIGEFNLSVNISYRLGYYYRRNSVNYTNVLNGVGDHADYQNRWQSPGDETSTYVPSIPSIANINRDNFYLYSDHLVEKGDHIRLQDIRMGYFLTKSKMPWFPINKAEVYAYANNLGMIWKATNDPLDPDFQTMRAPRSLSFGIRMDF